jgi:hypothetical protein
VPVLLITPPFTQLNTPYPASAYLTGFLDSRGIPAAQADLGLETVLALFSRRGLSRLFGLLQCSNDWPDEVRRAIDRAPQYLETVDRVIRVLQGGDPTFATRICQGDVLPQGPRFASAEVDIDWAFGAAGSGDRARYLSTLYLYDLADLVRATVAPRFGLSRYAESLAIAAGSFDGLASALAEPPTLVDELCESALAEHLARESPSLVGLTVPFPGNLYGALRIAQAIRKRAPTARIALGGGYVNTELRELSDPRLFDYVDFVTFDDGERPIANLYEHLAGDRPRDRLTRTLTRSDGKIVRSDGSGEPDVPQADTGTPTYRGLPLSRYLSVIELANPMHRLWSDGRWSKLTVAHGCYWKRCTFCDIGLDYIGRYEPVAARTLVDRMDALVAETGESGFHFVDEAAPPLALVETALEILRRGRCVSWWGNIRFEKTFTRDVCRLLAASGCIAVSGGLEVASDRLLALMDKGVTVEQVARVASAFTDAGVMVHAYLMYGFPTETAQETVDSLERVRQLFAAGALQSAFWHRFTLTRHAPIAADAKRYQIRITTPSLGRFANNDLSHEDPTGCDPELFSEGLRTALYNYMHGVGLDRDVRSWFDEEVPRAKVAKNFVKNALAVDGDPARPDARVVWLGGRAKPIRRGLAVAARSEEHLIPMSDRAAAFFAELLPAATPLGRGDAPYPRRPEVERAFPGGKGALARFLGTPAGLALRAAGLAEVP